MKTLAAVTVALAVGCAAFIGCGEKPVRAPIHESSPRPAASASTPAPPPADSASAPPSVEAPPMDAAVAPGEVACGKASCRVGKELCCPARGACEAIAVDKPSSCEGGHAYQCDAHDDCRQGELCCWLYGDPAAVTMCSSAPCPETEACRDSAGCAGGFTCKDAGKENAPGTCVFAAPKTSCGKVTCSGATPVCRWDSTTNRGACIDSTKSEASDEERDVRCSSKADCGGESCCFSDGRTWCGACVNNPVVCKTKADCPSQLGGGQKLERCAAADRPEWPPWLRLCEYADP